MFLSTYAVSFLMRIVGTESLVATFPVWGGLSAVCGAIAVFLTIRNKKHPVEYRALES